MAVCQFLDDFRDRRTAVVCLTGSSLNSVVYACFGVFFIFGRSKGTLILRHPWQTKFRETFKEVCDTRSIGQRVRYHFSLWRRWHHVIPIRIASQFCKFLLPMFYSLLTGGNQLFHIWKFFQQ
jgi:hypothetical protein